MGTSERPIKILLVEDNPADARLTQEALKESEHAHNLSLAENGEVAMAMLRREGEHANALRPDLILLDLNMPRMDGREVLTELKRDSSLNKIPVVVLTVSNAQQDLLFSYGLGASSYVRKTLDVSRFKELINQLINYWVNVSELPSSEE